MTATLQRSKPMSALSGKAKPCEAPGCRVKFAPQRPFQCWCSPECGLIISRFKLEKKAREDAKAEKLARAAERKADRAKKEQFKRMFIGVIELPNGEVIGMSSATLTTVEFSEFCTKVEAYAATELGVTFYDLVPLPADEEARRPAKRQREAVHA